MLINKKRTTSYLVDYAVLTTQRVKIKENQKMDKYLDVARGLKKKQKTKKLWNMKVMLIPIVVGALGMVSKNL